MNANYIGGEWVKGPTARRNINPSDLSDTVGDYAQADAAQAKQAIGAALDAGRAWAGSGIELRATALDFIGSELIGRRRELGILLAREQGKTLPEAIAEVQRAGHIFKFFGAEALRQRGDRLASVRPGVDVEITREPVGVVGIITPWNFPLAIPAWKIAPALAYGNTVVFKPADLVPGSAWALAEIISRSGIAPGAFNLVMGRGSVVGQEIAAAPAVAAISFTGSTGTGHMLMMAAAPRHAKLQLEMGGKNPLLVLNDADLAVAIDCAVQGAYFSTGQRCTASSRFLVEKGVYPQFVRGVADALAALRVGHALRPETQIGPVADASQLAQNLEYVGIGKAQGAHLAYGGETLRRDTEGYFMSPALFTDAAPEMRIAQEEIFGPVACAIPADNYEHALGMANASPFGLSAGICTGSLKHATHFKRHSQSGMAMVNVPTAGVDYHVPFGGTKASSYGSREQGSHAEQFFTTVKTAYTKA